MAIHDLNPKTEMRHVVLGIGIDAALIPRFVGLVEAAGAFARFATSDEAIGPAGLGAADVLAVTEATYTRQAERYVWMAARCRAALVILTDAPDAALSAAIEAAVADTVQSRSASPKRRLEVAVFRVSSKGRADAAASPGPRKDIATVRPVRQAPSQPDIPPSSRLRVLLAEDDPAISRSFSRVLEHAGFDVVTVRDGASAIECLTHEPFDVVLSDVHMPGGSGTDVARVVHAYDLDVAVVLISGDTAFTSADPVTLGATECLPKPVRPDDLANSIRRAAARTQHGALALGNGSPHAA